MRTLDLISGHISSLEGKTIAISGSTGGIGCKLCDHLASLGARLVLLDRNSKKSNDLISKLTKKYPSLSASHIQMDLEDIDSVREAAEKLEKLPLDVLILNAGAYSIPRRKCSTGYDNVFQINFVAPYFLVRRLLPFVNERGGKIVAVGSIAHTYSHADFDDIDFSGQRKASKAYGNAKRYLMFSLYELFDGKEGLSVAHPGITFTNITNHYPKLIFAIIKHPMKIIFMKPEKACLSIVRGVFDDCVKYEWIGPKLFNVWGLPKKQKLRTCIAEESRKIFETAEKIYENLNNHEVNTDDK